MSAKDLIESFGDTVSVYPQAQGDFEDSEGEWVKPDPLPPFETIMSIQPMSGRDLMNLPEGQRTKNFMVGYASVELKTVGPKRNADRVLYRGRMYEVQRVEEWRDGEGDLDHWRVTLAEANE